jgi:prolyl 4-hydroxylase
MVRLFRDNIILKRKNLKRIQITFEGSQLIDHDKGMGQRTYTFMIYLNEVKEGGETEFKKLNQSFSPMKGKALIWN